MSAFLSFKRSNLCPICNSQNCGCKQSFVDQSKNRGSGKFLPTDLLNTLDDERQREWQEQRKQKRIQEQREWEARQAVGLNADKRNTAYRALLTADYKLEVTNVSGEPP